jgi:hypothetical protein
VDGYADNPGPRDSNTISSLKRLDLGNLKVKPPPKTKKQPFSQAEITPQTSLPKTNLAFWVIIIVVTNDLTAMNYFSYIKRLGF